MKVRARMQMRADAEDRGSMIVMKWDISLEREGVWLDITDAHEHWGGISALDRSPGKGG